MGKITRIDKKKIRAKTRGPNIPAKTSSREQLIGLWNGIYVKTDAERKINLLDPISFIPDELRHRIIEAIESRFDPLIRSMSLPVDSRRRLQYMRILNRKQVDLHKFFSIIPLFASGRELNFEKMNQKGAEEIISLMSEGTVEAHKKLIIIFTEKVRANADSKNRILRIDDSVVLELAVSSVWLLTQDHDMVTEAAMELGMDEDKAFFCPMIADESMFYEVLLKHGLYFFQDKAYLIDEKASFGDMNAYVASDNRLFSERGSEALNIGTDILVPPHVKSSATQHEIQHVFCRCVGAIGCEMQDEYRAFLGELSFGTDRMEFFEGRIRGYGQRIRNGVEDNKGKELTPHAEARLRIEKELSERNNNEQVYAEEFIEHESIDLLNLAYKSAVGMTYDQLVQPFKTMARNS